MHQIDTANTAVAKPAPTTPGSAGYFTDGDSGTGVAPTRVGQKFLNTVMCELMALVEGAGITLDHTDDAQVLEAVQLIAGGSTGGIEDVVFADSPYLLTKAKKSIAIDTAGGACVIELPDPATCEGHVWELVKVNAAGSSWSFDGVINGVTDPDMGSNQYEATRIKSWGSRGFMFC